MPFIVGKKLEMDQVWSEKGRVVPVTIIEAGPVFVTQVKDEGKDGYSAFQVGYGTKKHIAKPQKGHLKDQGPFSILKEFKPLKKDEKYALGDSISVSAFEAGDSVRVVATSKGRGFAGVVKRHGFHGGPKSHGQKDRLRAPGSIGVGGQQRVIPGRKMAGRMGSDQVTRRKVQVVFVDAEKNLIALKGAIPGTKKTFVFIHK